VGRHDPIQQPVLLLPLPLDLGDVGFWQILLQKSKIEQAGVNRLSVTQSGQDAASLAEAFCMTPPVSDYRGFISR
jgi:hypothetical protein